MATRGNENACEGKECTSNSSSSSNMGQVAEVSSLCLDCQGRKKKEREMNEYTHRVSHKEAP